MTTPDYDPVTNTRLTGFQKNQYKGLETLNRQVKKTAENGLITNNELQKLNQTSAAIAAANAALISIQSKALNESSKQTALLNSQLEIAKINELERNRQNQIKQAAFSVDEKIKYINHFYSGMGRYFHLKNEAIQIGLAGLTSDAPNEITDKQYVRDVLKNLEESLGSAKSLLNLSHQRDVDIYYSYIEEYENAQNEIERLQEIINSRTPPEAPNKFLGVIKETLYPRLIESKIWNTIFIFSYYHIAYKTMGISLLLGSALYYKVYLREKENYDREMYDYESLFEDAENAELLSLSHEKFFENFKKEHNIK
jgi:hypothetical protein